MSIFDDRRLAPMLIGASGEPFDSPDYLFEMKFDGVRCLAYLDQDSTKLLNKRNLDVTSAYPELAKLHKQAYQRCILDGELVVFKDGKPVFSEIQRRALMSDPFRIRLAAEKLPVCFVAFDILFWQESELMSLPLEKRKDMLADSVRECASLIISRVFDGMGTQLYALAERESLEGVVAKRKGSLYYPGKRTKDWIKIKNLLDDDFVVLGYLPKDAGMNSIILGQYDNGKLVYKGHVTLGVGGESFRRIASASRAEGPPVTAPRGNEDTIWLKPQLVCTVKFMERTTNGSMRQPVFKGLRADKRPEECVSDSKSITEKAE